MPVSTNWASATLLSDGSGTFASPPYYNGSFSGATIQYEHNAGVIRRTGAGWGSCAWDAEFGPDSIMGVKVGAIGEMELEIRGVGLGSSSTWDAYSAYYAGAGNWTLYRTVNGSTTSLTTASGVTPGAGDLIGFEAVGSGSSVAIALARYTGGAWGADFITYSDTNAARLVAAGRIGSWANGQTFTIDELYGGTIAAASSRRNLMMMGCG